MPDMIDTNIMDSESAVVKDDGLYKELQNLIEKQNPKVEQIWL